MAELHLHFENFSNARNVQLGQQTVNLIAGNQYLSDGNGSYNGLEPSGYQFKLKELSTN